MRKLQLVAILFSFFFLRGYSQRNDETIRNIVPPSPQAFEMGKYGNMPLNEYHGMAQISIPIAEVKDHTISSNITLNYANLGVKVADIPTNVGVSWLLQMGGVITRTVYDLPDEYNSNMRILLSNSEVQNVKNILDKSAEAEVLNSYHLNPQYDNEIDIFQFSVNGLSGKFYLDKDLNPVLLSRNNLVKIETVGDLKTNNKFIITDVDGTQYYFGGNEAIEKTFIKGNGQVSNNVTSFYLTKIKNRNNVIDFIYNILTNTTRSHWLGKNEILPVKTDTYTEEDGQPLEGGEGDLSDMFYSSTDQLLNVKNPLELISIVSQDKTININYYQLPNSIYREISSIDIKNNYNNKLAQTIDFKYLYQQEYSSTIRFFLEKIQRYNYYNNEKTFESEHSFTYEDALDLPNPKSFAVDVYGYYNGQDYNNSYLPDLKELYKFYDDKPDLSFFPSYHYANRNSDIDFAKKGTLKTIQYPTKGTTHFEYEGLENRKPTFKDETVSVDNDINATHESKILVDGSEVVDDVLNIRFDIIQTETTPLARQIDVFLKIQNADTGGLILEDQLSFPKFLEGDLENPYRTKFKEFKFITNKNIKYKIILSLVQKPNVTYFGQLTTSYINGYITLNNIALRLKRTFDQDENGNKSNIKRLYYTPYNNIYSNNSYLGKDPYPDGFLNDSYQAGRYIIQTTDGPWSSMILSYAKEFKLLSSNYSSTSKWDNYYEKFSFRDVTISFGGDNFEKGGEEKSFKSGGYKELQILRTPAAMQHFYYGQNLEGLVQSLLSKYERTFLFDDFNGKPLMTRRIANKGNNNLVWTSKTTYNYNYNITNPVYNLIVEPAYNVPIMRYGYTANNMVFNLFAAYSPLPSYNTAPLGSVETMYLEDVPLNTVDDTPYKKLITSTEYFYTNPAHNQITSQKTTFPDNTFQETTYQYAQEKNKAKLIEANMVGIPLETTVVKKQTATDPGKTISKTETVYPDVLPDSQTGNLLFPKSVSALDLVSGNMSTEVTYNQYDTEGNIQQYTTKNGISTAIVWGYNQTLPIAKVEGATYAQISSLAAAIISASNDDAGDTTIGNPKEQDLLNALDAFRNNSTLSGYQITTYTYDPLIGVKSITPPSGVRQVYIYDAANRLKEIREQNQTGNLLKEYQYNYKH